MSCEVIALPILLAHVIGSVIAGSAANTQTFENMPASMSETSDDTHVITAKHFMEKSFETVFTDKDTLVKTLEEHGVINIKYGESWEKDKITGQVNSYSLSFEKPAEDKPYNLVITCLDSDNAEEKLNDLSSEYALNVQEDTYLSIIEKLKDNNMELEEEEVLEDNTIVLTVNID